MHFCEIERWNDTESAECFQDDMEREVDAYVRRKFETAIKEVELVQMEDLDLKNHLSGLRQKLLRVICSFCSIMEGPREFPTDQGLPYSQEGHFL